MSRGGVAKIARGAALVVAAFVAILLGVRAALPPAPLSALAPAASFSAERALPDTRIIAMRPHPTGSRGNAQVRTYLLSRMTALGLAPEARHYLIDEPARKVLHDWSGGTTKAGEVIDLIGVLPGRDRYLPAIALMAHYDSVWGSPGGGDDAIGVGAILEIVRALKTRGMAARDVVVLLTDGEEIGLAGAKAFWGGDALAPHIGAVINLEARGAGGRALMFETGAGNGPMMALYGRSVTQPVANSAAVLAYRLMPNSTDFDLVRENGLPGFNFAILGRPQYYHSARATADRLDPASLQDMGAQTLAITSALAFAPALPGKAADSVFFDIGGCAFADYSISVGWWIILASAGFLAMACLGAYRRGSLRAAEVGHGAVALVWLLSHALLALIVFDQLSGSIGGEYYDRLAKLSRLEAQAMLVCVAALAGYMTLRRWPRRLWGVLPALLLTIVAIKTGCSFGMAAMLGIAGGLAAVAVSSGGVSLWGGWLAALTLMLVIAIGMQIKLPLAAWLFAWPALIGAITAAIVAWSDPAMRRPFTPLVPAVAAVIVSAPLLPVVHLAFLGVGYSMPEVMLAALPILAAVFWPLARAPKLQKPAALLAALLLVAAGGVAHQIRTEGIADTVPAYVHLP